ncbi:uncharacterized protein LOC114324410 [Diabrotica virgifera virgifera]|uniref:Large ribosomal subunit protein uL30m n=1 Tax=Diabrotica virgifera virgifera TaxID=50390 RepID=A0A6P7EYH9_DIAVI|nr:uncharacterized protein LOC114324410 [Diabrotica virgifera virgifera]XP_050503716.1 uncharacterized protein LOC114324410 [Diabrotica virgifera virgifera]
MVLLNTAVNFKLIYRSISKRAFNWYEEGLQHHGFKYYPKNAVRTDPSMNPAKLFRVELKKPFKGAPYWEKHIMKEFKLDKVNSYTIVKNIPENNQRLWKIKYMINITPITFPNGFPHVNDVTYLQENGELNIIKKGAIHKEQLGASDKFRNDRQRLDGDTLRRHSRQKWLTGWDSP